MAKPGRRQLISIYLASLWRMKALILASCFCLGAFVYVFLVLPGALDLPDFLKLPWQKSGGPVTTEAGTVISLSGGKVRMMRVEYGDEQVMLLAPLSAKVGDIVDVTHYVERPESVVSARMRGQ
jgi:hypothetical protein